ncbi:HD domain-containing protein [Kytococcus aerolatus]|uniref:HD domain-containing protein n=1 Tax=Kytococcus aerolatus TaxID=592308 RepID=A0A212T6N5_9MICO|nr:HD domain-containing protein [Kytococcus aerolatus]SNC61688.1 HD domain-containing protein [Kytococcus aerolatus]
MRRTLQFLVPAALAVGTFSLFAHPSAPVTPGQWAFAGVLLVLAVWSQTMTAVTRWLGLGQSLMGAVQAVSWMVAGPWVAVLSSVAALFWSRAPKLSTRAYNWAGLMICSCAGYWIFVLAGGQNIASVRVPLSELAVPVALGSFAQLCVNLLLALWGLWVVRGVGIVRAFGDGIRALNLGSLNQVVGAVLWALLVWAVKPDGIGLLLGVVPLLVHMALLRRIGLAERTQQQTVATIVGGANTSDPYVVGHGERVARYAQTLGRQGRLGPLEIERLDLAARLHDVGFIAPTPRGHDPRPGHAEWGAKVVSGLDLLEGTADLVRRSHQPLGDKAGSDREELVLGILQVADALDACVADDPATTLDEALRRMAAAGTYHPMALHLLERARPPLQPVPEDLPGWFVHDLPAAREGTR